MKIPNSRIKSLLQPFLLVFGLLLFAFILLSLDIQKILGILSHADPLLIALSIVITSATFVGRTIKWRQLFFEKKKQPLLEDLAIFLKGFFLSAITPGRVGELGRAFYLKETAGFVPGLASVLLDRLLDFVVLLVMTLGLLLLFFQLNGIWVFNPLIALAFLILVLATGIYLFQGKKRGFFRKVFFFLVPEKHREKVASAYSDLVQTILDAPKYKKKLAFAILAGFISWSATFISVSIMGSALGIQESIYFFAIAGATLTLIDVVPIIGIREAASIVLFSAVGIQAELAVAFSLTYFFIEYVIPSVLGGVLFMKKPIAL